MMEGGHYAGTHIRAVAARLDRAWKEFAAGLDERTALLGLSVLFHHKAEQYVENVPAWGQACENMAIPSEIMVLESAIHQHRSLYDSMCQAYTEVSHCYFEPISLSLYIIAIDLCTILPVLPVVLPADSTCVSVCQKTEGGSGGGGSDSAGSRQLGNPAADYSEGAGHVLDVIHQILNHHRALEHRWHSKKIKLHQRLALRLFQEDVKQVLDWLANHGEVFLRKNTGVGRTLQKARVYQNSHQHFENVAQVIALCCSVVRGGFSGVVPPPPHPQSNRPRFVTIFISHPIPLAPNVDFILFTCFREFGVYNPRVV
ncbi:hypothetical protein LSTR_LSTR014482 [Laodelphax striatellus]|uniref:Uncharacterized protein n=1 Tax=Laodelphax striatellus TaxID=195883 RepID=A0A482WED8_LAOST|nr:hypothetical protein LSTR_LSTR014482 [Laodelphax striatellus]